MTIEAIIVILGFIAFDIFLFWLSAKPERMQWMRDPSDPVLQRFFTRGAAWVLLALIGVMLFAFLIAIL